MSYEIQKPPTIDRRASMDTSGPLTPPSLDLDVERSVRMYPKLAWGVGLAVAFTVAFNAMRLPPMYSARTTVYVQPVATKVLGDSSGYYDQGKYESYLQQQMLTAVRPDILSGALADPRAKGWQRPGESMDSAIARLANALKVARVQTSYEITFAVTAPDRDMVAPLANAVTDAFLKLGRKDELSQTDERMQLLSEERDRIDKELEAARAEQRQLGSSIGVASTTGNTANPFDVQLMQLRTELASAREAHDVAAAQLQAVTVPGPTGLEAATDQALATDPELNALKQTLSQKKAQLVSQMAGLTPSNPAYKEYDTELKQLDRQLESMTQQMRDKASRSLQDKLRLDLAKTGDVEARLNAQLARETASATTATPKLQRAEDLAADIARLEARYASVDDAMRGLAIESNSPGLAHLAVPATPPTEPDASRRGILLALALPLGLLFGTVASVIARKQNPRVQVGSDIQSILGFQPMAMLPAASDVSQRVLDEYILRFAGGIDQAMRRGRARSYLLTAVSPSADIGTLVHALSLRLDQLGFRTMVVRASAVLQPQPLAGPEPMAAEPGISPASALDRRNESSFLANIERLQQGQDLLLIESDPILTSAETEYVARIADVTILIAESDVTLRAELSQVATLLKRLGASGVGAVLTEVKLCHADRAFRMAIRALEDRKVTSGRFASDWRSYRSAPVAYPDDVKEYRVPSWQDPDEPADDGSNGANRPAAARRTNGTTFVSTPVRAESPDVEPAADIAEAEIALTAAAADPVTVSPAPIQPVPVQTAPPAKPKSKAAEYDEYAARLADAAAPRPVSNPPVRPPRPVVVAEPEPEPVVFPIGFTPPASDSGPACFAQYAAQLEASELLHSAPQAADAAKLAAEAAKIAEQRIAAVRAVRDVVRQPVSEPAEPAVVEPLETSPAEVPVALPEPVAVAPSLAEPIVEGVSTEPSFAGPVDEAARAFQEDAARRRAYLETRAELVDPSEMHFNPIPLTARPAHRNDFAPDTKEEKTHRSWVHRIFRRDSQAPYRISPEVSEILTAKTAPPVRPIADQYEASLQKPTETLPEAEPDRLSERLAAATQPSRQHPAAAQPPAPATVHPWPGSVWDEAERAMQAPEPPPAAAPQPVVEHSPEPEELPTAEIAASEAPIEPVAAQSAGAEANDSHASQEFELEPIATTLLPDSESGLFSALAPASIAPPAHVAAVEAKVSTLPDARLETETAGHVVDELPTAVYVAAKPQPDSALASPVADLPAPALPPREEIQVSMPLVPMRADYVDAGFDFGNELAAWRPLPLSEPQPIHDSFVRPSSTSAERREAYLAAARLREIKAVADTQTETPIPQAAPESEAANVSEPVNKVPTPVFTESTASTEQEKSAAPVAPEPKEEKTVRTEVRRFHLLHQFDRPIVIRGDAVESRQGGAR